MTFVQIIELQTSRIDEVNALGEEYRKAREAEGGKNGPSQGMFTADRDRKNHYINVIQFDSHVAAMENSNHPATTAFAEKMRELCDSPPTFHNLDVIGGFGS